LLPTPCYLFRGDRLQNPKFRLCCPKDKMDRLAKLLFPKHPKLVRFRKLQALWFTIFLSVAACAAVGLTLFYLSREHPY
jgi:hypothetical protein